MGHVPHLLLDGEWAPGEVQVSDEQLAHLTRVLRLGDGATVSYTDGAGTMGEGQLRDGLVVRGAERQRPRPSDLVVVVAPVDNRDRSRFMVEKLSELGVAELRFLKTRYGQGRPPREDRLRSWAVSGLEQSRGAWLMRASPVEIVWSDLPSVYAVCEPGGSAKVPHARTVVVGPEGGWAPGEIPESAIRLHLGDTVLRVETAAIVAAARMI